ncbi:alpha-L-fucosidase [Polaribacter sp.]|uniref:alpha-L-fucosidase n=1 Tax=Polaribacter sp. TaxID=1920175 RepID=UPI003EFA8F05
MNKLKIGFLLICILLTSCKKTPKQDQINEEYYSPNYESLNTHEIPDWALDAKFGIYAHWGPYTMTGDWPDDATYPKSGNYHTVGYRGLYKLGRKPDPRRVAFEKRYGAVKDGFGYKTLAENFTASKFDPIVWADLVQESGAKYAGLAVVHHDGFLMWDSKQTLFNAGNMGPKRDVTQELFTEFKKRNIKTMATFHHARSLEMYNKWIPVLKEKPEYKNVDLLQKENEKYYWFLDKNTFSQKRFEITKEFIQKYKPDCIWFDSGGVKETQEETLSTFFNMGIDAKKEVSVHNKDSQFGKKIGLYSFERGYKRPEFIPWPWEDDTTASNSGSWCWWHGITYKKSNDLILRLCHLVANNGGLLLSLNPRPDGSFDPEMVLMLKGIGKWLKQNEEAIHGSRPWEIQGEGHLQEDELRFQWNRNMQRWAKPNVSIFDETDIRFTTQNNTLYAIQLAIPKNGITTIKSLGFDNIPSSIKDIKEIQLVGYGKVGFNRTKENLQIQLPSNLPNDVALVFKVDIIGKLNRVLHKNKR